MKSILIIGAGLSAKVLINYLSTQAKLNGWEITIAEQNLQTIEYIDLPKIQLDVTDDKARYECIKNFDVIISMVPARFHFLVAKDCLALGKHLFTASYISPEMKALEKEVKAKNLLFLNECGLDPGLDHMSAMKLIHNIKNNGGEIIEFESSTGGLVAPEYDNNPWNYKFTWNPRNVVLAGMEPAKYLENGKYKYIPYHRIFQWTTSINIPVLGDFEVYPNRDSLKYRFIYGLENVKTMLRGTIRRPGYCKSWNAFVQLGLTDDSYEIENIDKMTWKELIASYLPTIQDKTIEDNFCDYLGINRNSQEFNKFEWLEIFTEKPVGLQKGTPAQALQHLLEEKWKFEENDKDLIIIQHNLGYKVNGEYHKMKSTLTYTGKDQINTAMATTVGLPLAIAVDLFMQGKLQKTGVLLPIEPDIYEPILKKLEEYGINFIEEEN
ncbi:MAG TPA: saccharopine dehydrogenase NADP-binding domain-containing protein [Bacteroidales bacterium]|nr:saccharopine dehydrogenase NADP-binding domain-containing protein [Bacteroidales bacterium]